MPSRIYGLPMFLGVLVRGGPAFQPEERVTVPMRPGDCFGDRRERSVPRSTPLESVRQDGHAVCGVVPAPIESRARFDPRPRNDDVFVTGPDSLSNFPQAPLRGCG